MLHGNGSMIQELRLSGLYELASTRYRVIVPDRPGYGYSSRPRDRWWGPRAQAALLRAMLARLGIERPILFAHSFGTLVALAYALEYPAATRSLVLASGYYFPTARLDVLFMASPAIPHLAAPRAHALAAHAAAGVQPCSRAALLLPLPDLDGAAAFPTWMALRPSQLRASAEEAALLVPSAMRLQRLYHALEVPAIIIAGSQDRYVSQARHSAELARRVPYGEFVLSPRAGHMVHHVDPRRVLHAIEAAAR
jgi:pimeloyl-ACP methyl ester carboxylesterase